LNLVLKIDNIPAKQTARICALLKGMPRSIAGFSPSYMVRFKNIEKNARAIEAMAFVNDDNIYFNAERDLNLPVLELLEQERIDFLYVK
jgi:MscS family membrane protein